MVTIVKLIVEFVKMFVFYIKLKTGPFGFLADDIEKLIAEKFETTTAEAE